MLEKEVRVEMMDVTIYIIILLCLISFIGICIICSENDKNWRVENKLIFAAVCLSLICLIMIKVGTESNMVRQPDSAGDTQVDKLLDEVRGDNKTIYFDDEFQVLVYKYLLKYTREGKYEVSDEEQKKLIDKAKLERE